ncbi:putative adenosine deaminase-related growth factor [Podospora fimiseda]|uniref:Adenosine deaminase-related growth factor n=1 Tax=Podospora fimiseda TaxID=252190 RepID=A0AAN7H8J9_9PEZI|nr:putative adenosine deaminase-related growth factor [Podospora fimiseda]
MGNPTHHSNHVGAKNTQGHPVSSLHEQWDASDHHEKSAHKRLTGHSRPEKSPTFASRIGALFSSSSKPKPKNILTKKRSGLRSTPSQGRASKDSFDVDALFATAASNEVQDTENEYKILRHEIGAAEAALAFDHVCSQKANHEDSRANELQADKKFQQLRQLDIKLHYDAAEKVSGYQGQKHRRFLGDHFLSNVDLIERTQLFKLFRAMPKGAHLHIHFNANLLPNFLLDIAKNMDRMYVWSNISLVDSHGKVDPTALDLCRIQFSILSPKSVGDRGEGDIFASNYKGGTGKEPNVMQFKKFLEVFPHRHRNSRVTVDAWLQNKLVFQQEETYGIPQTAEGAWEKFNARTQMMKGLFNYKTAYEKYTIKCLEDFVDDNIQYVEIRPNFMSTNQVWSDDGLTLIDNAGILDLIINQYTLFQKTHREQVIKGLKIIYCTPRSFTKQQVHDALVECLKFKLNPNYGKYIAGFDLVGEEGMGHPLNFFMEEFILFKKACAMAGTEIPFLFHCGETLDIGTDTDGNLLDALLLGSKRIGHGFALPRHPLIMEQMKKQNVCVEVCPISNEILGLTPRISGHSVYNLLANNVHCTVSTDNGTFFRSRLSHDFYQIMAGKSDMTLHGFRQLIEWSIEHSCMESDVKQQVYQDWEKMWNHFCKRVADGEFDYPMNATTSAPNPQ